MELLKNYDTSLMITALAEKDFLICPSFSSSVKPLSLCLLQQVSKMVELASY